MAIAGPAHADRVAPGGLATVITGGGPAGNSHSGDELKCEGRQSTSSAASRSDLIQLVQNRAAQAMELDIKDIKEKGEKSRVFHASGSEQSAIERIRRNQAINDGDLQRKRDWDPCKGDSPFEFREKRSGRVIDLSGGATKQGIKSANEAQDPKFKEAAGEKKVKTYQERVKDLEARRAAAAQGRDVPRTERLGSCEASTIGKMHLDNLRSDYVNEAQKSVDEYVKKLRDQARRELASTHPYLLKIAQNPDKDRAAIQAEYLKELEASAKYIREAGTDPEKAKGFALYRKLVNQVIADNPDRDLQLRTAADDMTCELENEAKKRGVITTVTGLAVIGCVGVGLIVPPAGAGCFYATSSVHLGTSTYQALASSHLASTTLPGQHVGDADAVLAGKDYRETAVTSAIDGVLTGAPLVKPAFQAARGSRGLAATDDVARGTTQGTEQLAESAPRTQAPERAFETTPKGDKPKPADPAPTVERETASAAPTRGSIRESPQSPPEGAEYFNAQQTGGADNVRKVTEGSPQDIRAQYGPDVADGLGLEKRGVQFDVRVAELKDGQVVSQYVIKPSEDGHVLNQMAHKNLQRHGVETYVDSVTPSDQAVQQMGVVDGARTNRIALGRGLADDASETRLASQHEGGHARVSNQVANKVDETQLDGVQFRSPEGSFKDPVHPNGHRADEVFYTRLNGKVAEASGEPAVTYYQRARTIASEQQAGARAASNTVESALRGHAPVQTTGGRDIWRLADGRTIERQNLWVGGRNNTRPYAIVRYSNGRGGMNSMEIPLSRRFASLPRERFVRELKPILEQFERRVNQRVQLLDGDLARVRAQSPSPSIATAQRPPTRGLASSSDIVGTPNFTQLERKPVFSRLSRVSIDQEVAIPRSSGGYTNARVESANGNTVRVKWREPDGTVADKDLPVSSLRSPVRKDDEVLVPRSSGEYTPGRVISVEDNLARVEVPGGYKDIHVQRLRPPTAPAPAQTPANRAPVSAAPARPASPDFQWLKNHARNDADILHFIQKAPQQEIEKMAKDLNYRTTDRAFLDHPNTIAGIDQKYIAARAPKGLPQPTGTFERGINSLKFKAPNGERIGSINYSYEGNAISIDSMRTHGAYAHRGVGDLLLQKIIENNPTVRQYTAEMAVSNMDAIRKAIESGKSPTEAIRQTSFYKSMERLGFGKIASQNCTISSCSFVLER